MTPSSVFAQTRNTSAIGALEIQVFAPVSAVAAGDLLRPRDHRAGVGAVVGLGQAEAADPFARAPVSADISLFAPASRTPRSASSPATIAPTSSSDSRCRPARPRARSGRRRHSRARRRRTPARPSRPRKPSSPISRNIAGSVVSSRKASNTRGRQPVLARRRGRSSATMRSSSVSCDSRSNGSAQLKLILSMNHPPPPLATLS